MQTRIDVRNTESSKSWHRAWPARAAIAALLWACITGAHATPIYKCVGTQGQLTYRDTPCATRARQTKLDITGQPLIDANAPRQPASTHASTSGGAHARSRRVAVTPHKRKTDPATSWECRATDGEVFYRHTRCPGSVPGDGVVRSRYAEKMSSEHTRARHDAWSRVRVHGEKVSRAEACRRIRSPSAAGRDGHQRDERVDTYARLTGHDPCGG